MASDLLIVKKENGVATLTLNDPGSMNAISGEMATELRLALRQAAQDANVVILAGDERSFCSGANLSTESGLKPGEMDTGAMLEDVYNPLIMTIRDLPIPVITAVRGAAAGIGASLALIGDIIVAGKGSYFLMPFRHIGLIPDGGAPWLLTRSVGRVRALEMMLLGEKIPAEKAFDWGLVTRCVEDQDVLETAMGLAQNLANGATNALALTRQVTWAAQSGSLEEELRLERIVQRDAGFHPDFPEGVAAFREKRRPNFESN